VGKVKNRGEPVKKESKCIWDEAIRNNTEGKHNLKSAEKDKTKPKHHFLRNHGWICFPKYVICSLVGVCVDQPFSL
jgi:hypothetical protein